VKNIKKEKDIKRKERKEDATGRIAIGTPAESLGFRI